MDRGNDTVKITLTRPRLRTKTRAIKTKDQQEHDHLHGLWDGSPDKKQPLIASIDLISKLILVITEKQVLLDIVSVLKCFTTKMICFDLLF